jgi:hypothetical protein
VVAVIAKCKKADLLQVCQCKQPRIYDGRYNCYDETKKDKVKASSGTKTLGTISNMGMSSTPKYGMGTKK